MDYLTLTARQLWVLIPDLKYSASCIADGQPRRAMKILYEELQEPRRLVEADDQNMEELSLPRHILEIIKNKLDLTNGLLPDSARSLNNLRVGLLDRFDTEPRSGLALRPKPEPG